MAPLLCRKTLELVWGWNSLAIPLEIGAGQAIPHRRCDFFRVNHPGSTRGNSLTTAAIPNSWSRVATSGAALSVAYAAPVDGARGPAPGVGFDEDL